MEAKRFLAILTACAVSILTLVPGSFASAPAHDVDAPLNVDCHTAAVEPALDAVPVFNKDHDPVDPCPGIRPGGALVLRAGPFELMFCSMAFIVTDGDDLYVATAGHCTDPAVGVGPRFSAHGVPGEFGTVVHRWCEKGSAVVNDIVYDQIGLDLASCGVGTDFALIKVDADKHGHVNAAMCHWGAPVGGVFTAHDTEPRTVQHFGWGMFLGEASGVIVTVGNPATQARQGVGIDFSDANSAWVQTPAISGDSGSGVLVAPSGLDPLDLDPEPQALGVLTHITNAGTFVQRLDVSLARAGAEMGGSFTLVTGE